MRSFTSSSPSWSASSTSRACDGVETLLRASSPTARRRASRGTSRIICASGALLAHPLEAGELALGLLADLLGQLGLLELLPVLLDDRGVVLAELLADRVHLAPEDVLALLLLRALLDVLADAPAHLQLGEHARAGARSRARAARARRASRAARTFCAKSRSGE